jgi:polyhydroxyalkanoate synthesis regulator phasin
MAKRKNTLTRFLEDIVDDTKDLVDDILDRAKDIETDVRDAVTDVVDDDESDSTSPAEVASLKASLAALQTKVEELTALQVKAGR